MPVNPDYRDLFSIFNEESVEYLIVGAYAVIYYTEPRYTKDLDVFVRPTTANAEKVYRALARFGAPLQGVGPEAFTDPEMIYQIGVEPNRIDIIMGIAGLTFEKAVKNKEISTYGGERIPIIGKPELSLAKKKSGRKQDELDIEKLSD